MPTIYRHNFRTLELSNFRISIVSIVNPIVSIVVKYNVVTFVPLCEKIFAQGRKDAEK